MRQTLGTRISAATARYYLPFRLPSDIYFSDIFVKTEVDNSGTPESIACYIRVFVYENEDDYVEVAGVPAGNPLMLWEGWVRNTYEFDYARIPINYVADMYNYPRYYITADYTNTFAGELNIEVLYSDVVSPSTANYIYEDHQGLLHYECRLNGGGAGTVSTNLSFDTGEWFEPIYGSVKIVSSGVTGIVTNYLIGAPVYRKTRTATLDTGETLYLDPIFRERKIIGNFQDIDFQVVNLASGKYAQVYLMGYMRTANIPTAFHTGSVTNEVFKIW